jgi:membrane protein DedA with SNARE-associated domain
MPDFTLATLVPWVIAHGYFIFYFFTIIEGPFVTVAAGIASALGYYNLAIIVFIAIAGDLTADIVYYFIGYYSRNLIIERHGHRFGLTKERVEKISKMVHTHFLKTMLIVKISPFAVPGLIAIGASHITLWRFIKISLLITGPKSLLFALLGFYSGKAYTYLESSIKNTSYAIGCMILIILIGYFIYQKVTSNLTKITDIE